MRMCTLWVTGFCTLLLGSLAASLQAQDSQATGELGTILKAVRPAPGEDPFAEIPWITSLWEAREKAAKEGKPILLWEMDGHPLGCG